MAIRWDDACENLKLRCWSRWIESLVHTSNTGLSWGFNCCPPFKASRQVGAPACLTVVPYISPTACSKKKTSNLPQLIELLSVNWQCSDRQRLSNIWKVVDSLDSETWRAIYRCRRLPIYPCGPKSCDPGSTSTWQMRAQVNNHIKLRIRARKITAQCGRLLEY